MYAKLSDNTLQIALKQVQWEGQTVINPSEGILLALGYLPVQYTDPPAVDDGYYTVPRWVRIETAIVQEWDVRKDTRPLTAEEVTALLIKQQINSITVDDQTALRMRRYYPTFAELVGQTVKLGTKFRADDSENADLYKTIQPELTIQAHYPPGEGTESLYTRIDEIHDGTKYDPIPYNGNMALENGKYYIEDGVIYLCNRDSGIAVYNRLADLVGIYVEVTE